MVGGGGGRGFAVPLFSEGSGMSTMGSNTDYSGRWGGGEKWAHNHLRFRYAYHGIKD